MSLESSQGSEGNEPPKSVTSSETDYSPVVQGDNEGVQISVDVNPTLTLSDPDDLMLLLLAWVRTPDWATSQTYLQTHAELLTEAAEQMLATLKQRQTDQRVHQVLTEHQLLLQAARQQGVEAAYQPLLQQKENDNTATETEQGEMQTQVIAWLQTPDWETSQLYLQAHPHLLTEAAEQMLEALKQAQAEKRIQTMISTHQRLLQEARVKGIKVAYERLLAPEPATEPGRTLSDQEQEQLLRLINEWVTTSNWEESQTYLGTHPDLLTDAAEALLAALLHMQQKQTGSEVMLRQHQQLLRRTRVEGVAATYQAFHESVAMDNMAMTALHQYWASGQVADLNRAVEYWRKGLNLTPFDSPVLLGKLGSGLYDRYTYTGELADLEAAIPILRQAVQATPTDSPDWPTRLNNLGNGLSKRYERSGKLSDLEAAITAYLQAVQVTSPDSSDWPLYLNNLGNGLRDRYTHTGELANLEAAIAASHQSVQATSPDSPKRPRRLNTLGNVLRDWYIHTGELADLEAAIAAYRQAVQAIPLDSPDRPGYLTNLSAVLSDQYTHLGELANPDAALRDFQQIVQALPFDSPNQAALLSNLGVWLNAHYERTGKLEDLDAAINVFQQALQVTPTDSPGWSTLSAKLGTLRSKRYEQTGDLTDLDAAITAYQQALQATSSDSTALLSCLGTGLIARYEYAGESDDLDAAINAFQQALQATSSDSPERPALLSNLSGGLHKQYERTGKLADLDAAISASQRAIQASPPDSPDKPGYLNNLGSVLHARYDYTGDLANVDEALRAFQQALQATAPDSPKRPALLSNLGTELITRYERTKDLADLEAGISAARQAVQATSPNSPELSNRLNSLGNGLSDWYFHTGDLADLDATIATYQQAIQATPLHSLSRPGYLTNLGQALNARYIYTGDLANLDAAITVYQQAIEATSSDSPDLPAHLNNLGWGLRTRYIHAGKLTDLETAISISQRSVQTTPSKSPDRAGRLNNLSIGLRERYIHTGELADLNAAISASQEAVQATQPNSLNWPGHLNNLGSMLIDWYFHTKDLADLDHAINTFQQAVQATLTNSPDMPGHLTNLGGVLNIRYAHTGDLADLDTAITAYQQAIQAISPDSPNRPALLNNLGLGLRTRYFRTGNLADLNTAITTYQQAIQVISPDSPSWPNILNNLGSGLRDRYAHTGNVADLDAAITVWEKGWFIAHPRSSALPVMYQLGQQRQGTEMAARLITAHLERARKHPSHSPGTPRRVLEIAEGSKSRLLTQLVGRGPLPLPTGLSAEIAAQEQQLLTDLIILDTQELAVYNPLTITLEKTDHLQRLQRRESTLRKLEDLWGHIDQVSPEGAAYVALRRGAALTWKDLAHLTKALGPTTILLSFFTTTDHALLFLLRAGWRAPRVIEVQFNQVGWADLQERFIREVHHYLPGLRRGETWDQPLRSLFTRAQRHLKGVERLILAPAGPGHLLPWGVLVERAGWHTSTGQPLPLITLPALSILPSLRQRPHMSHNQVLVVGNPRGDLPYAEAEAKEVAERFGTVPLLGAAATKSAVLARFPDATLIHLATHAFFHSDNPLESGIELSDGVLTAREILQHRLQADLLILSACESGQIGSLGGEELAGLSQAFLQIGVRSLLVSLWPVNDTATATLIQAFYTARQAGIDKAQALRQAMTQIQQDPRWAHPYYWGAFVLMGDWN